ncbi:cytochrome P450 [Auricularia subglabra TFB-10046 SS5]|uniref:Cytochrome P450 n=1 Tax=Auricularia subglabra (strain TFB-10046 / SS5) TaxID=717982 RepID=J0WWC0_AURST|nr:cytochrome P450 [Auricularia subglabra TFB-10046 SS5]
MTVIRSDTPGQPLAWPQLILVTAGAYVAFIVVKTAYSYWKKVHTPLRRLPGPKGGHFFFGHMRQLLDSDTLAAMHGWAAEHGDTYVIRGIAGAYQLVTTDTRALTHILFASNIFHKSEGRRKQLEALLGKGLLFSEGERHRDQRRIMNPAFGHAQVRDMTETFLATAAQLCELWNDRCNDAGGTARVDIFDWLSKATLDIIGKTGFDYEFNALNDNGTRNELAQAFDFVLRQKLSRWAQASILINEYVPTLAMFLPNPLSRNMANGRAMMDRICTKIVQAKKQEILAELGGHVEKKSVGGKDLLSLLMRANLAADVEPSQRLTDLEVLDQIPTFIMAGHETTRQVILHATQTTWALHKLSLYPEVQRKLRAELLDIGTDMPSLDELNSLPYLDHVARESLRLNGAVGYLGREVFEDDAIPLGAPMVDARGNTISQIKVQKGDGVLIPIRLVNHSKAIWGPDADEFRPERWEHIPSGASSIPGIAPNLMTFIGGPRSCIGHRFATAEFKALLFQIIRRFEVHPAIDEAELSGRSGLVIRPQLRKDNSTQLPILITPVA